MKMRYKVKLAIDTNLIWENLHEYAQGGTPCHCSAHALKKS